MKLKVSVSPNNQVKVALMSLGQPKKNYGDSPDQVRKTRVAEIYSTAQTEIIQGYSGGVMLNHSGSAKPLILSPRGLAMAKEAQARSLDIIEQVQRQKTKEKSDAESFDGFRCQLKAGYGFQSKLHRFSRKARHRLLCGGSLFAKEGDSPDKSTFVTLTLPGNTARAFGAVARWASYVCNRLMQFVRRASKLYGEPIEWLYVWELQKRGALHMHLVLYHPESGVSCQMAGVLRDRWFDILKDVSNLSGVCLFARANGRECVMPQFWQADVSPVRKSVGAYLSKYVSKSSSLEAERETTRRFCPPRWWGMARSLLRRVREASSEVILDNLTEDEATSLALEITQIVKRRKIVQSYNYSFDINYGDYHVGSGNIVNYYLEEADYECLFTVLGSYISSLLGSTADVTIDGTGVLFRACKRAIDNRYVFL